MGRLQSSLQFAVFALSSVFLGKHGVHGAEATTFKPAIFDFSVLHARNTSATESDPNYTSYFCVIDLLVNTTIPHDKDYLPLNHVPHDLCEYSTIEDNDTGYLLFNYSLACGVVKQIDNFERHFPRSKALIFSTSCSLNLRSHFNLSTSYLSKKKFKISVITDSRLRELQAFKQLKEIQPIESKNTAYACMILIFSIACFCVFVGALWSGSERHKIYLKSKQRTSRSSRSRKGEANGSKTDKEDKNQQEAYADLTLGSVVFAVVITIIVLMSLYFFYKYIVFFFIAIFMIFSALAFYFCVYTILLKILPEQWTRLALLIQPCLWRQKCVIQYILVAILPLAIGLPIWWFTIRHTSNNAWILQDLLCICFCVFQLRTLRLPSFKICFMLMSALFIYDIFFVFITPLFTSNGVSIMEYVATGGVSNKGTISEYRCPGEKAEVLPLSIRAPRNIFGRDPHNTRDFCISGGFSLLGLGDIIIPGIMVSYSHSFDLIRNVPYRAYLIASSFGYAFGLVLSYIALITMEIAQPALLYLVPTTTISVILVALIRKECRQFWSGPEVDVPTSDDSLAETESSSLRN